MLEAEPQLINAVDENNHTPLFEALFIERIECAKTMLTDPIAQHIDASILDKWGRDPYDVVNQNHHLAELEPLLRPIFNPSQMQSNYEPVGPF